jgi:hypothetical protein
MQQSTLERRPSKSTNKSHAELTKQFFCVPQTLVSCRHLFLLYEACPSIESRQSTALAESCCTFGSGASNLSTLLTMAEQSTSSYLAWVTWNETFFVVGSM